MIIDRGTGNAHHVSKYRLGISHTVASRASVEKQVSVRYQVLSKQSGHPLLGPFGRDKFPIHFIVLFHKISPL